MYRESYNRHQFYILIMEIFQILSFPITCFAICISFLELLHQITMKYTGLKYIDLKQQNFIVSVLDSRNLKSRCRQGPVFLKALGQSLFHAFLLTCGVAGNP